ncbi:hypothetical protein XENOCAPTIV_014092, partial [Xenoophorus captivus]
EVSQKGSWTVVGKYPVSPSFTTSEQNIFNNIKGHSLGDGHHASGSFNRKSSLCPHFLAEPLDGSNIPLGCPWRRLEPSRNAMMVAELKLQPCVLELCKFFSQCLCRPFSQKTRTKRFSHSSKIILLQAAGSGCYIIYNGRSW